MRRSDAFLAVAVVLTVVLWNVPYGEYVLYPFRIFATWMHELGHGLAALLVGRDLLHVSIQPDTSGVAWHSGASGRLALAFVASAGYLGTSLAGAVLVVLGRRERRARSVLGALGALAVVTAVLYVRGLFGFVAVSVLGVLLLVAALRAPPPAASFLVNLLGAQSAVNALTDIRALFVLGESRFDGNKGTDAATVADLLFLPYWFWAALWMALSVALLAAALWMGRRRRGS
jgi:hypothetical protein